MVFWVPVQFVVGLNMFRLLKKGNKNSAFKWVSLYTAIAALFMIFEIIMYSNLLPCSICVTRTYC